MFGRLKKALFGKKETAPDQESAPKEAKVRTSSAPRTAIPRTRAKPVPPRANPVKAAPSQHFQPLSFVQKASEAMKKSSAESPALLDSFLATAEVGHKNLEDWLDGKAEGKETQSQWKECVQSLWKLMDFLRRSGRFEEALRVWALLRKTTRETRFEEVELALALAQAIKDKQQKSLRKPRILQRILLFAVESTTLRTKSSEAFQQHFLDEVQSIFKLLRVDWSSPTESLQVRLSLLEKLSPFHSFLPANLRGDLFFWHSLGAWRLSSPDQTGQVPSVFEILLSDYPGHPHHHLFRWYCLRAAYEAGGEEAIPRLQGKWPATKGAPPETLARYFEALSGAERVTGLRKKNGQEPLDPQAFHQVLKEPPPDVTEEETGPLQDHLRPVLKALSQLLPQDGQQATKVKE